MASNAEVKLVTARGHANIALNGTIKTVADLLTDQGRDASTHSVRVNNELISDLSRELVNGDTVTAFETQQIASAGAKAGAKSL